MGTRRKSYELSEGDKKLIVSRLLGDTFAKRTEEDKETYCGYIDGTLCEVVFYLYFWVQVYRYDKDGKFSMTYPKWGNHLFQLLMNDSTLDLRKGYQADFNQHAYVEVMNDKVSTEFLFRNKPIIK